VASEDDSVPNVASDLLALVICLAFEFYLYRFVGCRQFRVSAYPLARPADVRKIYIKPAGHDASEDREPPKSRGKDYRLGLNMGRQFVYDSAHAVGITDKQESHQIVLGSLKIAIYLSQ
jgi:hypothetical protein